MICPLESPLFYFIKWWSYVIRKFIAVQVNGKLNPPWHLFCHETIEKCLFFCWADSNFGAEERYSSPGSCYCATQSESYVIIYNYLSVISNDTISKKKTLSPIHVRISPFFSKSRSLLFWIFVTWEHSGSSNKFEFQHRATVT